MREKNILITGTGRCGTTFLILMFTYLNQGTGYGKNVEKFLDKNCNSGLEHPSIPRNIRILKCPLYLRTLKQKLITNPAFKDDIRCIIIPIRDYEQCAESRERHGIGKPGGLYGGCQNKNDQFLYDITSLAIYLKTMVEYNIDTLFLDFDQMVKNPEYLFNKINHLLINNVSYDQFLVAYKKASDQQKNKKK
jgi:hypothetical protein